MVAQFTAKTANSEKAIYILSLISCSIKKLKSHMLLTCKYVYVVKKFCTGKWGGGELAPPALAPFPYGPVCFVRY